MLPDIDDYYSDLTPSVKPSSNKTEGFLVEKTKTKPEEKKDSDEFDLVHKKVPKGTPFPTCGVCRIKLRPSEMHWYYLHGTSRYWWCNKCIKG